MASEDVAPANWPPSRDEAVKMVAAVLRPGEERCAVAIPARIVKGDKKRPRLLAVIYGRNNETGLFVLKVKKDKATVTLALPVFKDTLFTVVSAEEASELYNDALFKQANEQQPLIRFGFSEQELLAQVVDPGHIGLIQSEFAIAIGAATLEEDDVVTDTSASADSSAPHGWLKTYVAGNADGSNSDLHRMDTNENLLPSEAPGVNPFVSMDMFQSAANNEAQLSFKAVKEQWIRKQLAQREKEFTEFKKLQIFCGTWNVNGKYATETLTPWLSADDVEPDLYVIGFQELDLSASAFLLDSSSREEDWTRMIDQGMKNRKKYRKVASKQLVGMLILVYTKVDHSNFIKEIATDAAGTGLMGMMGNKGGVAIRLRLYDTYLVFVNTHLAAGKKEVERRNLDFSEVARRITFTYPGDSPSDPPKSFGIHDSDYLFWIGDLNYRLPLPDQDVRNLMDEKKYKKLLKYDQLNVERKAGRVFVGFEEGTVTFQPSYKYDPGTDNFDTSEKRRSPAWCDRILWRKGDALSQLNYRVHMELRASDHKPVSSLFEVSKVKVFLKDKQNEVQLSVVRDLDKFENEVMPDAQISNNVLEFGQIKYLQPVTRTVTLENVGQVLAQFKFIPKLQEENYCKPWLWIAPSTGILTPGEKGEITFTVLVDKRSAPALNKKTETIDDILILHLENGKDVFISISGEYEVTSFGTPLDVLTKLKGPIRAAPKPSGGSAPADASSSTATTQLSVPKELWRIVDYIFQKGIQEPGLFLNSGDIAEMELIRDCLDSGEPFALAESSQTAVHSMAETLIRFLDALPEPVIPFASYQKCIDNYQTYPLAKQSISTIPSVHYHVFVYLTAFLREVLNNSATNLTKADELAAIFSAVLLRSPKPVADKYREVVNKKAATFLTHFFNVGNDTASA